MNTNQFFKTMKRWFSTFVLLMVCMLTAEATNTFYYKLTVTPSPSGGGKVYASTKQTTNPSYQSSPYSFNGDGQGGSRASATFYLYAEPAAGYEFDHWAKGSANGENIGTALPLIHEDYYDGGSNSRTQLKYYAVFNKQTGLVKVMSANISRGTATINNSANGVGDEVILTANPDVSNGIMFLGWNKSATDEENFISTENPYTFTVSTDNQGTYYAHFSDAPTTVYLRIQNKKTGRFLSLYGTTQATNHQRTYEDRTVTDGFKFSGGFKMISSTEAQGNPSTVFLRSGHHGGSGLTYGADLSALGTSYHSLVNSNSYMLNFEYNNGTYRIYIPSFTITSGSYSKTMPTYLCDEGNDYPVIKTIEDLSNFDSNEAEWYVYLLDENTRDGAFGANTKSKFTQNGKYYTTMYTDFPYQLLDGVKAYILPISEESVDIDNAQVKLPEITTGKVPANTAVILECLSVQNENGVTTDVKNRLLPLTENVQQIINPSYNALKGYISLNGNRVTNDKDKMYVLSSNKDVLGFYHSTSASMTPFKAYLDFEIPEGYEQQAKNVKFAFGNDSQEQPVPTAINTWEIAVDDDSDPAIYDLNGRKVADSMLQRLPKGVYIQNGKKFIVK